MLRRQSWRPHQRKLHILSRHARDRMLRRGLGPRHGQKAHSGTYETHQRPPAVTGGGAASEGQPQFAASRMGVGPLHTIDEVAEGNEAMEKRERQEGITTGQAKGRTQRWQPLQPNLARVNEAVIDPPRVLSEEPTAVTPHGGIRGGESQQRLSNPTQPPVRFGGRGRRKPIPTPISRSLTFSEAHRDFSRCEPPSTRRVKSRWTSLRA